MSTISSNGKVAYVYNESSDTWHPIAGAPNTTIDYSWSGTHNFGNDVSFADVVNAKAGINNFQNPTARDAAITSPSAGTVVFVRQDNSGNSINQIQYYSSTASAWVSAYDATLITKTASYTLELHDSGKTFFINSSSDLALTVPQDVFPNGARIEVLRWGTGEVTITPADNVTIRSKNSNKKLSLQYSGATLIKVDTNEWALVGDLKA